MVLRAGRRFLEFMLHRKKILDRFLCGAYITVNGASRALVYRFRMERL
jgi:hypothetical protein